MKWIEIIINVNKEYVELISEIFYMLDVSGIQIDEGIQISNDNNLYWDYIDEIDIQKESKVSAYFSSLEDIGSKLYFIKNKLADYKESVKDIGSCKLEIKEHMQEDWENSWKQYFKPVKITDKIVVKPQWESYLEADGELVINIDPGMAFGTGSHETTSMCIKAIEKNVITGGNLLDIGCGSGILSIASILLGMSNATGVDLDPVAVNVSKENVVLNNVSDRIDIIQGDLISNVNSKYDIVVANIIADAILILLDYDLAQFIKNNGVFICSGIILDKEEIVIKKMIDLNFEIIEIERRGEWVCITSKVNNG